MRNLLWKERVWFVQQRSDAKKRSIEFQMSFEEWHYFWVASGHLHERGRKLGQYVMARKNDSGPYRLGNVEIVSCSKNHQDAALMMRGIAKTEAHKEKMRQNRLGKKASLETRLKIGAANKGRKLGPFTEEHKQKLREAAKRRPGRKLTSEQIERRRIRQTEWWAKHPEQKGRLAAWRWGRT